MTMRPLLVALAAFGTLLLAGCGFTPLYGTPGLSPSLASIEVVAPETRTGHLLREELDDALARDRGRTPAYTLELKVNEERYARGLRIDDVATRYEVALNVDYILRDAGSRRQLTTGTAQVAVTYDSADPPYAGVVANQDGQERAAAQAADRIRLDLARWFATDGRSAAAGRSAIATR